MVANTALSPPRAAAKGQHPASVGTAVLCIKGKQQKDSGRAVIKEVQGKLNKSYVYTLTASSSQRIFCSLVLLSQ